MANSARSVLLLSGIIGLVLAPFGYAVSPETVPLHYDAQGHPDRWGDPMELLIVYLALAGLGTALFLALPKIVDKCPPALVNLPNRDYWLSSAHREEAILKFATWSYAFGSGMNVLTICLQLITWPSQTRGDLDATFGLLLASFLLYTLASTVWLLRAFRLPS